MSSDCKFHVIVLALYVQTNIVYRKRDLVMFLKFRENRCPIK